MRIFFIQRYVLLLLISLSVGTIQGQIAWPSGQKSAIVLTYDDGLDSQLNFAVPQLNEFGFKGTFFLYGYLSENKFDDWKKVSDQGHEMGNHSLFHPCMGNGDISKSPRFYSEDYDVPSMLREINVMNKLIFAITGEKPVSYAYPCGETMVGGIDYADSLKQLGSIKYARIVSSPNEIINTTDIDFYRVPSFAPKPGADSEVLIDYVKNVSEKGGLGILLFHGVGGDYLETNAGVHRKLLEYLHEHQDEIWVASFGEVMEYIEKN